jgi:hypothetical protein
MDIVQNSIAANAKSIIIEVIDNSETDLLQMIVQDDGKGMDPEMVKMVIDPFITTRTTRKVGLGIPLLKEAAELANGFLKIESEIGKGTRLFVQFQRSHIDRMPMGDLSGTFLSLVIAYPDIHFVIKIQSDGKEFFYDDTEVKKELEGISFCEPCVIEYLRGLFESGVSNLQV